MSYEADEQYTVYNETIRKARKQHKCDACKLPIRAGDLYAYVVTICSDGFNSHKRCGACQTTHLHLRKLCSESGDSMWPDERLNCGLKYDDEWEEEPPKEIAALPFLSDSERGRLLAAKPPSEVAP